MISTLAPLIAALCLWMAVCAWCGYRRRFIAFLAFLLGGLALNMLWMTLALHAHPFELNALVAQSAATLYALCAFGIGWFGGRIRRAWQDSRVE